MMKKIFALFSLLLSYSIAYCQYPLQQFIGTDSAIVTSKGGMQGRFVNVVFVDTLSANQQRIKQYPGAMIYAGGKLWVRNTTATGWTELAYGPITPVNIYNSNGTLTGDRTLFGNNFELAFTGLSQFDLNAANSVGLSQGNQYFQLQGDTGILAKRVSYSSNIGSSFTKHSIVDKNYVDSLNASGLSGSGTTNYVPKFTATKTLGNSQIFDNGSFVGVGTNIPSTLNYFEVKSPVSTGFFGFKGSGSTDGTTILDDNTQAALGSFDNKDLYFFTFNNTAMVIKPNGNVGIGTGFIVDSALMVDNGTHLKRGVRMSGLPSGPGTKSLRINANGTLSVADTTIGNPGTVTSIATNNGTGITGGTITSTGTLAIDTALISTRAWRQKGIDSVTSLITARPTGSGTTNYVSKWTGTSALGNSQIFDNGTNVGIGTTNPTQPLSILFNNSSASETGITVKNSNSLGRATISAYNDNNENGVFGIYGTAFPASTYRNNFVVGASKSLYFLSDGGIPSGGSSTINFITGGYENNPRLRITAAGRILIGTTTESTFLLDVNGTARVSGNTYLSTGSQTALNIGSSNFSGTLSASSSNVFIGSSAKIYGSTAADASIGSNLYFDGSVDRRIRAGFVSDIYFDTNGDINFRSAGTGSAGSTLTTITNAVIKNNGNVGIGTTSPSYKLDVVGDIRSSTGTYLTSATVGTTQGFLYNGLGAITFGVNTSGNALIVNDIDGAKFAFGTGGFGTTFYKHRSTDNKYYPTFVIKGNAASGYGTGFDFYIGTSIAMNLSSNSNLLIGTTTDAGFRLDVSGTFRSTLDANINSVNIGRGGASGSGNTVLGSSSIGVTTGTNNTIIGQGITGLSTSLSNTIILADGQGNQRLYIDNTGRAGFGAPSSFHRLQITNNNATQYSAMAFANSASSAGLSLGVGGSTVGATEIRNNSFIYGSGSTSLLFGTNSAERMRLTAAGRLLLGTTTESTFLLDVNGTARVQSDAYFATTSGSVGIGTTSPNASALLDLTSTSRGLLPPRMTGAQAEAIATPAAGLLVYANNGNGTTITSTGWWGYDGAAWVKLN